MRLISLLIVTLIACPALADVEVAMQGKVPRYAVRGPITDRDYDQFTTLLVRHGLGIVDLDSPGGDLQAAMSIGNLIRKNFMGTVVPIGAHCASACVFILQAGVKRIVFKQSTIGLHRPRFAGEAFAGLTMEAARDKYNDMLEVAHGYWTDMGGSAEAWRLMVTTPSNKIREVDPFEADELGLDGEDPAMAEYWRARDVNPFSKFAPPRAR